jgi:hypothetical protein
MADMLEKKLGDLVRELENQRDQLKRDLAKVNAQLELIAGLISVPQRVAEKKKADSATVTAPTKVHKATPRKRKVGRPAKKNSKIVASAGSKSERTLKEELVSFAKSHGGVLRVRDASQSLVKSGRYSTKEQAAANIYAAIKYYKGSFVKDNSTRGSYRVKG